MWDATKIIALKKRIEVFLEAVLISIRIKSNKLIKRFVFLIVRIQRNHHVIYIVPSNGFKAFKTKNSNFVLQFFLLLVVIFFYCDVEGGKDMIGQF